MKTALIWGLLWALLALGSHALETSSDQGFETLHSSRSPANTPEADADRVKALPGVKKLDFSLFSGYITVDSDAGRALFYTLAESSSPTADADPLVLFLNGGPGCSSLGGGFLSELGPFYPTPGGKNLIKNDYAWNQVANIIFLESPAFVGWSYSNTSSDSVVGDRRTAKDSFEFLLRFVERFPKYAGRPFWLAGESYAGHYLPNLAVEILKGGGKGFKSPEFSLDFKGFLLGNPWTDASVDNQGAVAFWFTHAIISAEARDGMLETCNFSKVGPLYDSSTTVTTANSAEGEKKQSPSSRRLLSLNAAAEKCDGFIDRAMEEFGGINIYDIYADVCLTRAAVQVRQLALAAGQGEKPGSRPAAGLSLRPALQESKYDPCVDDEVEIYMNRADVQAALHANSSGDAQPGPWVICTPNIEYSRKDLLSSMLPVYDELLGSGLEMLVYSGDIDAIVPVIGTRAWIRDLGLKVKEAWRPWRSTTGQVGGWTVKYGKGLSFASVRGAGHMVPYTQPERAFYLFSQWVHGKPLEFLAES